MAADPADRCARDGGADDRGREQDAEIDTYDPAGPAGAALRNAGDQVTIGPGLSPSCAASR